MASFIKALGFNKIFSVSFGLIASLFLLWVIFNSSSFVPEGLELKYTLAFLGYGILGVYTFGREDLKSKLSQIPFFRSLLFFIPITIVTFFVMSFLLGVRDPLPDLLFSVLIGVPFYLQMINAFVFATIETSFFQVYLQEKSGLLLMSVYAGLMHMFIWPGLLLFNFFGAMVLFFLFGLFYYYTTNKFGLMAVIMTIALHTGYNLAKYNLIFGG